MLIDWFTVGAQALNFLILVWLLKRFLYQPILHAIDERERRIATELANADQQKIEARQERSEFQAKNEAFAQERAALLDKATQEAVVEGQRLLDSARQAAEDLRSKQREMLRDDAYNLNQALQRKVEQEVFAIARKVLTDLAATDLEQRLIGLFMERLRALDDQTKDGLATALKSAEHPALVRTAFELPVEQRTLLNKALNESFAAQIEIRFVIEPDLISGIELSANGQKVAWSIADYMASLEKGVDELLNETNNPITKIKAKAEEPDVETKGQ